MRAKKYYSAENTLLVFLAFAVIGGFLESYTFLLHGGVFCNAQTGNIVLLALSLLQKQANSALHYAFSIFAYIIGILCSAILPRLFQKKLLFPLITLLEAAALAAIAFIPGSAPDFYTYTSVSFLCALQYNSFTVCRNSALSTTFCTNNLRQATLCLFHAATNKDKNKLKSAGIYFAIIFAFIAGAVAGAFAAQTLGNFSVLCCSALLLPICLFIYFHNRNDTDLPFESREEKLPENSASACGKESRSDLPADKSSASS